MPTPIRTAGSRLWRDDFHPSAGFQPPRSRRRRPRRRQRWRMSPRKKFLPPWVRIIDVAAASERALDSVYYHYFFLRIFFGRRDDTTRRGASHYTTTQKKHTHPYFVIQFIFILTLTLAYSYKCVSLHDGSALKSRGATKKRARRVPVRIRHAWHF